MTTFFDTNALLTLLDSAFEKEFIISQQTLIELENIKVSANKDADVKFRTRRIARLLDENYGKYKVIGTSYRIDELLGSMELEKTPDNIILAAAKYANDYLDEVDVPVVVYTDDLNCRFISREIFGLETKGIEDFKIINHEEYSGTKVVSMTVEEMAKFYGTYMSGENQFNLNVNQYLILKDENGTVFDRMCWTGDGYRKVVERTVKSTMFGDKIRPKDEYQACAVDSIMTNTMTALSGKAGSGKSLISLMCATNLIESGTYDRIVIMFNPTKAKGASDMGFYTGSSVEKAMQNSIGSILTTKFGDRYAVDDLLEQDKIRLVSMADVRGMEVRDNEILYITECQNTSIELLKLCLSRCSSGAKIIIEGDFKTQVDSYMFDGSANGMKRAIEVLTGEKEFGYVMLPNVHRSRIAALVEKM